MVDPADIRKALTPRTKCIFIGYPSNPTGAVATRAVMLEIGKIAEEHDLLVVSDEIYDRLVYDFEHVCFPALSESLKRRTILLGGFSKDYAMTGWRIGYACGPADIIQGLVRIHQYTIMSAPTTAQDAALEALNSGNPYVEAMVAEYDRRRRLLVSGLNRLGLHTFEPRGAFYAFPNIQASGMDDETFAEKLLLEARLPFVSHRLVGPVAETILEKQRELGCDSIVMSTQGHGRIVGALLGSISAKVLHLAEVPVTLVKNATGPDFSGRLSAT